MKTQPRRYTTIDEYISTFPEVVQEKLRALRETIHEAAPMAREKISYQIPTFTQEGNLVHFAAYRKHIGFYPSTSGIEAFKGDLSAYESSKGAVRFPIDHPLPLELISRIVRFRVQENLQRAQERVKKGQKA